MLFRLLFACFLLSSCTGPRMLQTDLYFAMSKPDGSLITEKEWSEFKEQYIAVVFKEGSTVVDASGSWFDPDAGKLINEQSHIVTSIHVRSKKVSRRIDSLRQAYVTKFSQQSVLRVDKKARASF